MKTTTANRLIIILLVATILLAGYGITTFDGEIAVHFDQNGEANEYMPVIPGMLFIPGLAIIVSLLFLYLPRIDPLGTNYESFESLFEDLKVLMAGIFLYTQGMIVAWNMGYQYDPTILILPIIVAAYYLTGEIMEKADRNWFIGIKTPWTLSSDTVWKKTHKTTAPLLKAAAVIAFGALLRPEYSIYFYAVPACAIALFATIYSYWAYREEKRESTDHGA